MHERFDVEVAERRREEDNEKEAAGARSIDRSR